MTVDAVRAGYRLGEYELDLEHRATGRTLAGFRHRGAPAAGLRPGLRVASLAWKGMRSGRRQVGVAAVVIVAFAVVASLAQAELTARGDLFVKFSGGITPDALPREVRAPISVSIAGTVRTLSGERPPALRKISIAINRGGRLDARGLPVCRAEPDRALLDRGSAGPLRPGAGRGRQLRRRRRLPGTVGLSLSRAASSPSTPWSTASARFSPTSTAPSRSRSPASSSSASSRPRGTYGTILTGSLPASMNRWGYLKRISLSLHRNYTYKGQRRSYLSAACDAPAGFPGATFPFAQRRDDLRRRPHSFLDPDPQLQGPGLTTPLAVILAIDQGTTGTHLPRLRRRGADRRPRLLGVRAALPAAGLGRARRRRDLGGDAAGRRARRSPTPASRAPSSTGSGSPTSARPWSPGTRRAASRSTAPWSGRTGAPPSAARSCGRPGRRRWCASGPG